STSVSADACRAPALPSVEPAACTSKCTCIVSVLHVTCGIGLNPGHGPPGVIESETKLSLPELTIQSVTAPPEPSWKKRAFPTPLPPMPPDAEFGGVVPPAA